MKILIASDSFKDCLSARKVAENLAIGISSSISETEIKIIPVADGGEGTCEAITEATGGIYYTCKVHNPLMRIIKAKYGSTGDGNTAVIEMAAASGLEHLKPGERNPWYTTSFGTGELIKNALDKGFRRIIIGIGGSATNDGGTGMAFALGALFFDKKNILIEPSGGSISNLSHIELSGIDKRIFETEILVASDVTNPLTGPQGASFIYAGQKGADLNMIQKLDKNLKNLSELLKQETGIDISNIPGSGAAGGMGAGLMFFLKAKMQSGFEIVKKETKLEEYCQWADVVITGEGRIDYQTKFGKTPQGVADTAKKYNKKVIAVAGSLGEGYLELYNSGFDIILSIIDKPVPLKTALKNAPEMLQNTGYSIGRMLKTFK